MTKVNSKDLRTLYSHLSVQSLMDIKDNFKEVSIKILEKINTECAESFKIVVEDELQGICFIYDADGVYNFIMYTGSHFARHKEECVEIIKTKLKLLKNKEVNSIIYKKANQGLSVLYSLGFIPTKEVNGYKVLELIKK